MSGYDTVVAALPSLEFAPGLPWLRVDEGRRLGGGYSLQALAPLSHCQVLYKGMAIDGVSSFAEYRVQASLPKALWHHNARELVRTDDVELAIDVVQREVASFLENEVDLRDWHLRRVDVTGDLELEDEGMVQAVLGKLAQQTIRNRRPFVGQSGSVEWPQKRGGCTRKAYSKYREILEVGDRGLRLDRESSIVPSKVGPAASYSELLAVAKGRLRVEVGALGQKAIHRAGLGREGEAVKVRELTGADGQSFREKVAGSFVELVQQAREGVDVKLVEAFNRFKATGKRSDRCAALIGYADVAQRMGMGYLEDMMSRKALWQVKRDWREAGVEWENIEFDHPPLFALRELSKERSSFGAQMSTMVDEIEVGDEEEEEEEE